MRRYWPEISIAILATIIFVVAACVDLSQPPIEQPQPPTPQVVERDADPPQRLFGYAPDPVATRAFVATLPHRSITAANPRLLEYRADEPVFLYRPLYEAYQSKYGRPWVVGRQGIGDCVSWGFAHGADMHLALMWRLGDSGEWSPAATEAIYGGSRVEARGGRPAGYSDGSYGAAAAKWLRGWGALHRRDYPDLEFDLSKYDKGRAKDWGNFGCGGRGDNGKADSIAKQHPITDVALVTTFREAAAAIQSGYPVAVCSDQGFSDRRDADGFARAQGTWYHCMVFCGVRFDRPGLLCLNSWGPSWISGPKWPSDQPDGSFWVDERTVDRMLGQGDSFAISGYKSFPFRDLQHGAWASAQTEKHFALSP